MKVVEFLNDWRDTIYYIFAVAITAVAFFLSGEPTSILWSLGSFVIVREILRSTAWISTEPRAPRLYTRSIGLMYTSVNIIQGMDLIVRHSLTGPIQWWWVLLQLINATIITYHYFAVGGYIAAYKLYREHMWDWPRKQKPPKHRFEAMKSALKELLQKVTDALAPMPGMEPAKMTNQMWVKLDD